MAHVIAERVFEVMGDKGAPNWTIALCIEEPVSGDGVAQCVYEVRYLGHQRRRPIFAEDGFQALLLAIRVAANDLETVVAKHGGRVDDDVWRSLLACKVVP